MAMEKYGTDYSQISPSDDALRELKKLASSLGEKYRCPKTMEEALKEIERLSKYNK